MNKKGAGKLLGYILASIVLVVIVLGVYGFFKNQGSFFQFLPGFNFTRPAVDGDAIVRYSIGSDSVEYYDGVQWYSFRGKQVLGSHEIDPNVLKSEFNSYWYQSRDTNERIMVVPSSSEIVPKTAQIISFEKGPAPYAGFEKNPFRGYTKVEYGVQSLASGIKQNYVLNYDDKLYSEGGGTGDSLAQVGWFSGETKSVGNIQFSIEFNSQKDGSVDKYFSDEVDKQLRLLNVAGQKGIELSAVSGGYISMSEGKIIAKDLTTSSVSRDEIRREGFRVERVYLLGKWTQYRYRLYYDGSSTDIYLIIRIKKGSDPVQYDTIVEAVPEYSSKVYKLVSDNSDRIIKFIALKNAVAKWRDAVLDKPADINGNKYCLRPIVSSNGPTLVAYLDQPTGQDRCR